MKIGTLTLDPPFGVAPMAGMTDTAFRRLVKRHGGCGLVVTEMVSAEGLVRGIDRTLEYAEYTEEERPVSIQIFGGDPERMAQAAQVVERLMHKTIKANEWYQRPEQMGLQQEPLKTPGPGDKLIVMFLENQDVRNDPIELQGIYRFSEQNQETVLKHMAPAERTGLFQLLAVLYILGTPFVCGYLEAAPANRSRRNSKRRLERKHVPLLVLVQFIAYAFYESGIPSSCNIRIDLIPIVPALAAAAIVAIRSLFPLKKGEQGSAP